MASAYPDDLDELVNPGSGSGTGTLAEETETGLSHGAIHAEERDAINAIQETLGINPEGIAATVADRLEAFDPEAVIYQAGSFTGSKAENKFPARSVPHQTAVAGGAAGDITVTGIGTADDLAGVIAFTAGVPADLTSEFTVTAADTINNTGGTNTTGKVLVVSYATPPGTTLAGMPFPPNEDSKATMPLFAPASWATVDVNILALAGSFGSGNVRLFHSGDTGTVVTKAVTASLNSVVFPDYTFGSDGSPFGQFATFTLSRQGSNAGDTLDESLCVIAVYLTPGA